MIIKRLKLDYFGKFHDKEIELMPGINLLYGENEAGKSTIHTFIRGMLFGIDRLRGRGSGSKEDIYTRYLPWDYPGAYGGQMDILYGDKTYRLQRSFHANDKSFIIHDIDTGREVKLKEEHISDLIPGLMESTFRNTISIEQLKAETDGELASQVGNYITNLSISKSREVNVDKAAISLKNQRKSLESIPYTSKIKALSNEIEEGEAREKKIDALTVSLKDMEVRQRRLYEKRDIIKEAKNQEQEELMDQLPAILERFRTHQGLVNQEKELENQIDELKKKISILENDCKVYEDKNKTPYNQDRHDNKPQHKEKKSGSLKSILYIVIFIALVLIGSYLTKSLVVGGTILFAMVIIGALILYISDKSNREVTLTEQVRRQEEYLKTSLSLENSRENLGKLLDRRRQLEDDIDEHHDTIMIYMQNFILEDELTAKAVERLTEFIASKKEAISKEHDELNSQIIECQRSIDKIKMELSTLEDNERDLIKNRDKYADIKRKHEDNQIEIEAINLALNTINELAVNIHDSFGKQLNDSVSYVIKQMTGERYQDIKIDEKLNVKLGLNDQYIKLNDLSAGTIDQVYLSLRLAAGDLLLGEDKMPLILDDSFALYDDKRVKVALSQIANRSQVIIFTCQIREKKLLEELGLSYNFIKL